MSNMKIKIKTLLCLGLLLPLAAQSAQFSIVVIPDTQMYAEAHPEVFEAQMNWITANAVSENIIYVAHLGDLKDDLSCDNKTINVGTGGGRSEWQIVDDTLGILDGASVAYGVVPGNHDFDQVSGGCPNFTTQRPLTTYNMLLGPTRFAGTAHYGDPGVPTAGNRVVGSNEDNFALVESDGVKFVIINLAYREVANPIGMDPEVTWADNLLKAYPDRLGIITSHYFMDANPGNSFGPYGQEIYDGLSNNPNLFMMLSAHEFGEAWRTDMSGRTGMQPVQAILGDYQRYVFPSVDGDPATPPNDPNPAGIDFTNFSTTTFGDSGLMRIMRFDTVTGMVDIETFIPPVIPIKNRPGTLVSTYFPASGAGMTNDTASNIGFSYLGYAADLACDGLTEPLTIVENSANRFEVTFKNDDSLSIVPAGATTGREVGIFTGGESASIAISYTVRPPDNTLEDLVFIFESIAGDEIFPDPSNQAGDVLVYSNANGYAGADGTVIGDGLVPGFANTVLTVTVGISREQPFCGRLELFN